MNHTNGGITNQKWYRYPQKIMVSPAEKRAITGTIMQLPAERRAYIIRKNVGTTEKNYGTSTKSVGTTNNSGEMNNKKRLSKLISK